MNFIEFTTDHWTYNEDQQEYSLEIPKIETGNSIKSIQKINEEDNSFSEASFEVTEDHLTFKISAEKPAHIRVNF